MAAARGIVARSGVAGLYRGNLVNVLRSAPQKSLDFFAFDMFKVSRLQKPASGSQLSSDNLCDISIDSAFCIAI